MRRRTIPPSAPAHRQNDEVYKTDQMDQLHTEDEKVIDKERDEFHDDFEEHYVDRGEDHQLIRTAQSISASPFYPSRTEYFQKEVNLVYRDNVPNLRKQIRS